MLPGVKIEVRLVVVNSDGLVVKKSTWNVGGAGLKTLPSHT